MILVYYRVVSISYTTRWKQQDKPSPFWLGKQKCFKKNVYRIESEERCPLWAAYLEAKKKKNTVNLYGPVYSGHPIYYGYWTTPKILPDMFCKLICTKRSPLYSGCGHPLDSQNAQFHYILPVHKGQQIGLRSNHAANFAMCPPKYTEKWILAKSSIS